ncbi:MAG: DUF5320 domain-containing protein [Eubacteriales bacterium]|nr:DUF5320 domain-containing protein [Eubacteriales bacterium]MDD3197413.1 DUF5320 domain-containing protein [Eubacteriales bacterium]MDD3504284.1 DUF5320 domain-containing protein [Eubacteriales bacterium]MDD4681910.1 DUF5320 domain-containing protein [Eubacteriales bacterium]
MPGFNGTGPQGQGSMTGRGMGACAGYPAQTGGTGRGLGLGLGRGAGKGRGRGIGRRGCGCAGGGFRFGGYAPWEPTAAQQKQVLKNQADFLESQLRAVREELGSIPEENNEQ